MSTRPLLSIGIIFRDNIRSIERCLQALRPLRDAIPCELVMADTGSEDGSRAVAEEYADILIDFPWINDFAAARNAVLDRCSGKWYLGVDTDEYLVEESVAPLRSFLLTKNNPVHGATVIIRNFDNYELTGDYTDFFAMRLFTTARGVRYSGEIHETLDFDMSRTSIIPFYNVIFNHDGYVGFKMGTEAGRKKIERNLALIREKLLKEPDDLLLRLQLLDSSSGEPDYVGHVRQAVALLKEKPESWKQVGPALIRTAISAANRLKLPEWDEWVDIAREWFPNSMYTRLDVEWELFSHAWDDNNYSDCIPCAERYLKAFKDLLAGADPEARAISTLHMATPFQEQRVKIYLAGAYQKEGRDLERAFELLNALDYALSDAQQTKDILVNLQEIHFRSGLDTSSLIREVWDGISAPYPSEKAAEQRKITFFRVAAASFHSDNIERERAHAEFHRYAYTLYAPLYGTCEIGLAARMLETSDPALLEQLLGEVEAWNLLPVQAVSHALEWDARFPLPDKPLPVEEIEALASRLANQRTGDGAGYFSMVLRQCRTVSSDWRTLVWQRELLTAAVRAFDWEKKPDEELADEAARYKDLGMSIMRAFAQMERTYIPRYYTPGTWAEENIFVLPPMHRFGWYCARAFGTLDGGDAAGYVRLLRAGLSSCESMKPIVEFLLKHTPELQAPAPSPELLALAAQIQTVLANFAPDDPAVAALKQSEAYQKVAWIIEGANVPAGGGTSQ